jgi:hypothetical protein
MEKQIMNANDLEIAHAYRDGLSDGSVGLCPRNGYIGEAADAYDRGYKDGLTDLCGEQG